MEEIYKFIDDREFSKALAAIENLPDDEKIKGRVIIAKADCKYELGIDLEALEEYVRYLVIYPDGKGKNFGLMGFSVCLKNLDLQSEAKRYLEMIGDGHEGKEKELKHSKEILDKQEVAIATLRVLLE